MLVFLNGRMVAEKEAMVSVFDRCFLYGDGLFETLLVRRGRPLFWREHFERLGRGAQFLGLRLSLAAADLEESALELIRENGFSDAFLRITLSRGVGPRGYSPRGAETPTLVMTLHPAPAMDLGSPPQWHLITSSIRLPAGETLALFKTCNKLPQIRARAEADAAGADEALLRNTDGYVAEAAGSNLFWIQGGAVCTPPLDSGVLAGVTRAVVVELCHLSGIPSREARILPQDLPRTEAVFLSLSTLGVVEALTLDGRSLGRSPLVGRIRDAYHAKIS